jgi:hypothetical protein
MESVFSLSSRCVNLPEETRPERIYTRAGQGLLELNDRVVKSASPPECKPKNNVRKREPGIQRHSLSKLLYCLLVLARGILQQPQLKCITGERGLSCRAIIASVKASSKRAKANR